MAGKKGSGGGGKTALTDEQQTRVADLAKAVKGAKSLEQLAEALDTLGRESDEKVSRAALAKVDFTRLPSFGGSRVEEEGVLSWDPQMVLLVGDAGLTDLTIKPRPGAAAAPEKPAPAEDGAEPATASAEAPEGQEAAKPAEAEGPSPEAFEAALRANADELGVSVSAVSFRLSQQDVTIEIAIPKGDGTQKSQTRRPRGKWAGQWRQIAAELAQQIAEGQG